MNHRHLIHHCREGAEPVKYKKTPHRQYSHLDNNAVDHSRPRHESIEEASWESHHILPKPGFRNNVRAIRGHEDRVDCGALPQHTDGALHCVHRWITPLHHTVQFLGAAEGDPWAGAPAVQHLAMHLVVPSTKMDGDKRLPAKELVNKHTGQCVVDLMEVNGTACLPPQGVSIEILNVFPFTLSEGVLPGDVAPANRRGVVGRQGSLHLTVVYLDDR